MVIPADEKALSLDPSSAEAQTWNTDLLATLGRLPAAIAAEKRGIELDPLRVSQLNRVRRRHQIAEHFLERVLALPAIGRRFQRLVHA